jgi:hypothetical protein
VSSSLDCILLPRRLSSCADTERAPSRFDSFQFGLIVPRLQLPPLFIVYTPAKPSDRATGVSGVRGAGPICLPALPNVNVLPAAVSSASTASRTMSTNGNGVTPAGRELRVQQTPEQEAREKAKIATIRKLHAEEQAGKLPVAKAYGDIPPTSATSSWQFRLADRVAKLRVYHRRMAHQYSW